MVRIACSRDGKRRTSKDLALLVCLLDCCLARHRPDFETHPPLKEAQTLLLWTADVPFLGLSRESVDLDMWVYITLETRHPGRGKNLLQPNDNSCRANDNNYHTIQNARCPE